MLLLQAAIAVGLCLSPAVFADELTTMLKEIQLTESEKSDNSTVLTPKIEVEGKSIRECFVRIHPGEGVSLAIPSSDGTAIIKRVYLSSKTGGIFLQENNVSRYVNLLGAEDKSVEREKQIEHDFIRQFGYLLRQRHPDGLVTTLLGDGGSIFTTTFVTRSPAPIRPGRFSILIA